MTPSRYQSGESDRIGRISRCGDEMTRMMLYEAAQSMLVRSPGMALARRLAAIMHRMWVDGTEFRWTREVAAG